MPRKIVRLETPRKFCGKKDPPVASTCVLFVLESLKSFVLSIITSFCLNIFYVWPLFVNEHWP